MSRFAAVLAVLALLAPAPGHADDVAEAKARFKKGAELYRAGKWREAIAEFEAAYRLKPAGAIHFNVAQCRERLSEWPGALRAYHDYLREVPDAKDRAAVRASIGRVEGRLAAAGVQALLVYSDPPGAAVVLDGRPRGTTPFHIVLPPGSYALSLALDGYEPVKEDVALPATASRVVDVVLRAAAPSPAPPSAAAPASPPARAAPPAPAAGPQPPDLRAKPPAASSLATPAPAPKPAEKRRVYTWIAAGTAVAAVAVGGWFGYSARKDESAIHSSTPPAGATPDQLAAYQRDLTQRTSDAKSKARTANLFYAAGGAAAAAGVTL
ncbi:MAG TPA: PEGA domain-containing protein, partial [Anaeromyxobacter sp.]|nr:PEGA domain-containing protein [Anaeromyxobacter sp.]